LYLLDIDTLPESFWSQIGRNTAYFYHPDETTADNFVILVRDPRSHRSTHVSGNLDTFTVALANPPPFPSDPQVHKDTKTAATPAIVQKLAAVFGGDF
jgi:hypothetical protein